MGSHNIPLHAKHKRTKEIVMMLRKKKKSFLKDINILFFCFLSVENHENDSIYRILTYLLQRNQIILGLRCNLAILKIIEICMIRSEQKSVFS